MLCVWGMGRSTTQSEAECQSPSCVLHVHVSDKYDLDTVRVTIYVSFVLFIFDINDVCQSEITRRNWAKQCRCSA